MKSVSSLMLQISILMLLSVSTASAQNCSALTASFRAYESRCAATGSIKIIASGGSGNYIYKAIGHVVTNFTSSDSITGLAAGPYSIIITDITNNCSKTYDSVVVPGTYLDPRFTLNSVDVSCDNGSNGSISVLTQNFGRAPFSYSIVAPSTSGVGTVSATGQFRNLPAGTYSIRLTDSCGGIQTRLVTINNYTWWIDYYLFTKFSCDSARGFIRVLDSKGLNSLLNNIPGMTYGIVRAPGDTVWSSSPSFSFAVAGHNQFTIVVKDKCGTIKRGNAAVNFTPSVGGTVNTFGLNCSDFTVSVTSVFNFFNPQFCLYTAAGVQIACNSTGTFTNVPYGSYCIRAHDGCTDTTILRCFNVAPPPMSVNNTVSVRNKTCTDFSAAVTGATGLTNPQYCLLDSAGNTVSCNSTGQFNNLPYGNYCIQVQDGCRDTSFTRCFTARKPVPVIPNGIVPSYTNCSNFGVTVRGDSLFNPRFCLYDSLGVLVSCNATGAFDSLGYGSYCISVYDSCYDTTITRCFTVNGPVVRNDVGYSITNRACSTFTAIISTASLHAPQYCLYDAAGVQLVCNTTGRFDSLRYGTYCVKTRTDCPDTTFTTCFTVNAPQPSISNTIRISNRTCTNFRASATGLTNLNNPQFCLLDGNNVQISCNSTGVFSNLNYGSYCITVRDGCYDTTIRRCFTVTRSAIRIAVSPRLSCNYGFAQMLVSVSGGSLPVGIRVLNPLGVLVATGSYNGTTLTFDNLPGTTGILRYTVYATDLCGERDSTTVALTPSSFIHRVSVTQRCPSATWQNGSGSIIAYAATNMGSLTVRIIKKDNVVLATQIAPSVVSNSNYTFNNLGPGTYVIRYKANDNCNRTLYDTIAVQPYQFPTLERSNAYQCDQNGFSIGAVVSNGVGPFLYEIIGSTPAAPSIVTAPQSSPVFNINNGTNYSLVRLRVVDACGNASLEDASILPLANNGIAASMNCFQHATTLSVDTIYNSTYRWYRKVTYDATDSTFLGTASSFTISNLLPTDTGWYAVHVSINNGCIRRTFMYNLNGNCNNILPVSVSRFDGSYQNNRVQLNSHVSFTQNLKRIVAEKRISTTEFRTIASHKALPSTGISQQYQFEDLSPEDGANYYRLQFIYQDDSRTYSEVIRVDKQEGTGGWMIYPNPARQQVVLQLPSGSLGNRHLVRMMTLDQQQVFECQLIPENGGIIRINRPSRLPNGIYLLQVTNASSGQGHSFRLIYY